MPIGTRALCVLFLLAACAAPLRAGEVVVASSPDIEVADLQRRLGWLADDARQGRDAIAPGAFEASAWIAREWQSLGLLPKGEAGDWYQPFSIPQPVLGEGNVLEVTSADVTMEYAVEQEWNPFSLTASAEASGGVAFAGYGISAPERDWDDYAGLDVKGKVVLVFRKNPGWREVRHASFVSKLQAAAKQGAAALLLCNDPATVEEAGRDVLGHWSAGLGAPAGSGPIPYAFVSQDVARRILGVQDLAGIETALRQQGPQSRLLDGVRVRVRTALATVTQANARNVVGLLPGRDPAVADEVVVVGAHYDHVGLGLFGSTGGAAAAGQVHNGADDNGSGTVALMELAEWFASGVNRPRRSVLFVAFTGEERGLLGSRHFVDHPTVALGDVVAMVNLDMVGRSRDGQLEVGGVGTAEGLQDLVAKANERHGLRIQWDPQGEAPSDSMSFFLKGLPVLFFFTGLHEDYHKPTDDVERINFADMARVCRLCGDVTREIAERDERLVFTRPPEPPRPPVLGIRPSPEPDSRGIVVSQVVPGGPAATGGVQDADVIVSIAGQIVRDPQSLRAVLLKLEAGKTVPVVVLRDDREITLKVTLGARGGRR